MNSWLKWVVLVGALKALLPSHGLLDVVEYALAGALACVLMAVVKWQESGKSSVPRRG